jgi:hypothetical protein
MKKFSISIPKPCSETVTSFTKMSDREVAGCLHDRSKNVFSRFAYQLKTYHEKTTWVNPGLIFLKAALASLLCLFLVNQTSAQTPDTKTKTENLQGQTSKEKNVSAEYVVKGIVKSEEDHQLLPGTNVYLKGTNEGIYADAEGKFEFPRKLKEGDVLLFSFVGFETQEYTVTANMQQPLEVTMIISPEIMMGEVSADVYHPKQSRFQKMWRKLKQTF